MSIGSSPARTPTVFGREYDIEGEFDSEFSADIQKKMTVPKSIHVGSTSDGSDMEDNNWNNRIMNPPGQAEKLRMQVPDRILVRGQEKHIGTSTVPREIQLDSAIMPPDPNQIRIMTPPRSITLFESSNTKRRANGHDSHKSSDGDDDTLVVEGDNARFITPDRMPNGPMRVMGIGDSFYLRTREGSVGPGGEMEELQNEVEHLRDQLGRVNRRIMSVENEMADRKDRETYIIAAGILYIAIQAFSWIFRSQRHH